MNFIGAHHELMNRDKIHAKLLEDNCEWVNFKFSPPSASHTDGSYQRQIRTVLIIFAAMKPRRTRGVGR